MGKINNKGKLPHGWLSAVLERFCDPCLFEGIKGDLNEIYMENLKSKGKFLSDWLYLFQLLGFFRSRFKKQKKTHSVMKAIVINYLITSLRSINKHKIFFGINLAGLSLAIACSLFALIYIRDEFQFDLRYAKSDQIYRLYKHYLNEPEGIDMLTAETSGLMGPTIMDQYPEVQSMLRICPWFDSEVAVTNDNQSFVVNNLYFADSTFLDFFDFKLLKGNPKTVLNRPSTIVLSESLANTMFSDIDPLGQSIEIFNGVEFIVTGVVENTPRQSHLDYDALLSWSTTVPDQGPLDFPFMNNWLGQTLFTYIQLKPGTSVSGLESKLPEMMKAFFPERADQYFLKLQPLSQVYLFSDDISFVRNQKKGSIGFIYILGLSALIILIIASVNYINITLSKADHNSLEAGVRKVMGSTRLQLLGRFITETGITILFASVMALIALYLLWPQINILTGKILPKELLIAPYSAGFLISFGIILSLTVGLYPALIQSGMSGNLLIRNGKGSQGSSAGWFRKSLLVTQFFISGVLIICTLIVNEQTSFLIHKPLGFNKDQVLIMDIDNEVKTNHNALETELLQYPGVKSVSISRSAIGSGNFGTTVIPEGTIDPLNIRLYGIDQEFFETYEIEILLGRSFIKGSSADSSNVIVNKAFVDFMGWEDPIGKKMRFNPNSPGAPIIGVVDDFHSQSPNVGFIEPTVLYLELRSARMNNVSVKIDQKNANETIAFIGDVWDKLSTTTPFDYYFVEDWFDNHLRKEKTLLRTSSLYSLISLVLCGLGLFGITSLQLQQRKKEISVRRVLGASVHSLITLISRQFLILILMGLFLAVPLAYYLVNQWLSQFPYKIHISVFVFILALMIILTVSVGIISMIIQRVANVNPSQTLNKQ